MITLGHGPQPVKVEQNGATKGTKTTQKDRQRERGRERARTCVRGFLYTSVRTRQTQRERARDRESDSILKVYETGRDRESRACACECEIVHDRAIPPGPVTQHSEVVQFAAAHSLEEALFMITLGHGPQPVKAEQNGARKEDKKPRSEIDRERTCKRLCETGAEGEKAENMRGRISVR